ncbi:MAG: RNA polymerase sigma factor (sigma-70 family) [Pirellulaceae bacterium]|jgi:RNA polymerase sigma factor (sigma-70 family)
MGGNSLRSFRMQEKEQWEEWIEGVRAGDSDAINAFWHQYGAALMRLADQNLQDRLRRRVDPEDVVQSAIRTFLRRVQEGQFELDGDDGVWRLICAITLNKARQQARRHLRKKRSLDQEVYLAHSDDSSAPQAANLPAEAATAEDAAILVDLVEQLLSQSQNEHEQQIIALRLQDFTNDEIANQVGCSERTVRRIIGQLRTRLERLLAHDE